MKIIDILLTGSIVVLAVWYLYRKIVVNKGCTCGSSSCNQGKTEPESIDKK